MITRAFIDCLARGAARRIVLITREPVAGAYAYPATAPVIELSTPPDGLARLTPGQARMLALELQAAAERIDPMPPTKPDRGPRARKGR